MAVCPIPLADLVVPPLASFMVPLPGSDLGFDAASTALADTVF
jgi:hypothetical protein